MTQISRDETFYFAMVIFQVEGRLFKVPRKPFEEQSEVFSAMFTLPPGQNAKVDGMSDDKPLRLDNIKRDDFRAFLHVLFPPSYGEDFALKEEEWLSILNLANMWGFQKIRQTAVEKLQINNIDLVTKVELAHRFDIREWLYPAYLALGKREEPLTIDEGARLGYDFALKMAQVRERLLKDKIAHPGAYRPRPQSFFIRSESATPRGGRSGARARTVFTHPFPGELEDEDDIVLSRAIQDIFGVRGEPPSHMLQAEGEIDPVLGQEFITPQDFAATYY